MSPDPNLVRLAAAEVEGGPPPPAELPMRMLVAVANPGNDLETGAEVANIQRRIAALAAAGGERIKLHVEPEVTRSRFRDAIRDHRPHILHFIGHGQFKAGSGLIYFHDEDDPATGDAIGSDDLRTFLEARRPWLVTLNSCLGARASAVDPFGGAAHNLIRINIPFVVAMQYPVSDEAAIAFSQTFYAELAAGTRVPDAVSHARAAIRTLKDEGVKTELITPVLYMPAHSRLDSIALAPAVAGSVPVAARVAKAETAGPAVPPVADAPALPPPAAARRWATLLLGGLAGLVALVIAAIFMIPGMRTEPSHSWMGGDPMAKPTPETSQAPDFFPAVEPGRIFPTPAASAPARPAASGRSRPIGNYRPTDSSETLPPRPDAASTGGTRAGDGDGGIATGGNNPVGGSIDLGSEGVIVTGSAERTRARLSAGMAQSLRGCDTGIALAARLQTGDIRTRYRLDLSVDHYPGGKRDRTRIVADYSGRRRIGSSGFALTADASYVRNQRLGLARRFVEGVGIGWTGRVAGVPLALSAGPAAVQTRFADGRARESVGGAARIEVSVPLTEDLWLDTRARIVAARDTSATAGVEAMYRLSARTALLVSADLDHEPDAATRRRTAVTARIGLAIGF